MSMLPKNFVRGIDVARFWNLNWRSIDYQCVHIKCSKRIYRSFHSSHRSAGLFWKTREGKGADGVRIFPPPPTVADGTNLLDKYIFVKTLVNFYDDIADGIILDTAYADSRPNEDFNPTVPVVVGLHDTPGSHHDLKKVLHVFAKLGCRTIAPTFPGHGDTLGLVSGFDDVFSHTTTERAAFVDDFLEDLGIERVDLVIGIGAACYPIMRLCTGSDTKAQYKSMALISPWPLNRPRYEVNPKVTQQIQNVWEHPFLRPSVYLFLPSFKFGEAHTKRDKITAAYLSGNLDFGEAGGLALATGAMNIPRIVMFGEKDPIVEKKLYYDIIEELDIPKANINRFKGKLETPRLPGALVFPDGDYDLHCQHSGVVSAYLLPIIQLFHPHIHI